jgi:hypothetical protein
MIRQGEQTPMNRRSIVSLLAACGLAAALPAHAQVDLSKLGLSRAQIVALNAQLTAPAVAPAIAFGSPVGFGAAWGQAYFGLGGQTVPKSHPHDVDGAATLGFGLGDPERYVGLDTAITAISVYEGLAEDGNVNFKLHRGVGRRASIAVGVDNVAPWGAADTGADPGYYGVYTQVFELSPATPRTPWALAMNVGVGNERFADVGDDVGLFASLAIAPVRRASFIVDWTGRDLNAAVSMIPFHTLPFVVTLGFINLTENNNVDTEFAGGLGWLWQF